jgi:CBS domain-containing protein
MKAVRGAGESYIGEAGIRDMETVHQVLRRKGSDYYWVPPGATVCDALARMDEKNVGALLVLDQDVLVGLVSERDCAMKCILQGKSPPETLVSEIMSTDVAYVTPEQTIEQCMALVTDLRTRHLPVMEGERILGVVSIGDLVKATIAEKDFVIRQLEHYIAGRR